MERKRPEATDNGYPLERINREYIAREISYLTGFLKKDVEKVLEAEAYIISQALAQGIEVKNHKLYQIELKKQKGGKSYDGINKRYYERPPKEAVKFVPLAHLKIAEKLHNKEELTEAEQNSWDNR